MLLQPIFLKCFGRIDTFYPLSEDMDDLSTSSAHKRLHEGSILYGPYVEAMIYDHGGLHIPGPGRDGPCRKNLHH